MEILSKNLRVKYVYIYIGGLMGYIYISQKVATCSL